MLGTIVKKVVRPITSLFSSSIPYPTNSMSDSGEEWRKVGEIVGPFKVTLVMPTIVLHNGKSEICEVEASLMGPITPESASEVVWQDQQHRNKHVPIDVDCRSGMVGDVVVINFLHEAPSIYLICMTIGWRQVRPYVAMWQLSRPDNQRLLNSEEDILDLVSEQIKGVNNVSIN